MGNSYWTFAWIFLGPILALQLAAIAVIVTVSSVRRRMGYRGYVELGPDMRSERYTRRAFRPAAGQAHGQPTQV
jgi:hypothetical protein